MEQTKTQITTPFQDWFPAHPRGGEESTGPKVPTSGMGDTPDTTEEVRMRPPGITEAAHLLAPETILHNETS